MKTITQNLQTLKSSLEDKPQINIVVVTKTRSPEEEKKVAEKEEAEKAEVTPPSKKN